MRDGKLGIYYACIEDKQGKITKWVFGSRDSARKYILEHFDKEKHNKCWTE